MNPDPELLRLALMDAEKTRTPDDMNPELLYQELRTLKNIRICLRDMERKSTNQNLLEDWRRMERDQVRAVKASPHYREGHLESLEIEMMVDEIHPERIEPPGFATVLGGAAIGAAVIPIALGIGFTKALWRKVTGKN